MAIMLITHDLGVVAENADVVNVMYAGRVVESATVEDLFDRPKHPYTEGLFRSMPRLGQHVSRLDTIEGMVPNPAQWPPGCKFHPRCHRTRELAANVPADQTIEIRTTDGTARVMARCVHDNPALPTSGDPSLREILPQHWAACHFTENFDEAPATPPVIEHQRQVRREVAPDSTEEVTR